MVRRHVICAMIKRESGANPEQSRCCEFRTILRHYATGASPGKAPIEQKRVRRPAIDYLPKACADELGYEVAMLADFYSSDAHVYALYN